MSAPFAALEPAEELLALVCAARFNHDVSDQEFVARLGRLVEHARASGYAAGQIDWRGVPPLPKPRVEPAADGLRPTRKETLRVVGEWHGTRG